MRLKTGIILGFIWIVSCKKPYAPPVIATPGSYLVVEGTINSGGDSTVIKLSKTVKLSSKTTVNPVLGAAVTVESNQNNHFSLTEGHDGNYVFAGLNLDNTQQYRLRIKTTDGQEYLSDFEAVQNTPAIDSVGYNLTATGLQIYANTHNSANNTRYYRWSYEEAWQFHAKYFSQYVIENQEVTIRNNQIYNCFASDTSSNIVLGSSAALKQDIIYQQPITEIPASSEKLETKYSILVRQYALTGKAFAFWTNLKKNTEQLGSIFDAQPSALVGNIHCISNSNLAVIGYVSVSQPQSKRIFISAAQLPNSFFAVYPYSCEQDTVKIADLPLYYNQPDGYYGYLTTPIIKNGGIVGIFITSALCANCTLRGTTKTPIFWK